MKRIWRFCVVVAFGFCVSSVYASDFTIDLTSSYTLASPTTVAVNQLLTIINNSGDRYPTGYEFTIPSHAIQHLKITNAHGQLIHPTINATDQQTAISFTFNTPIVGKNKMQSYTLEYENNDILVASNSPELAIAPLHLPKDGLTAQTKVILPRTWCKEPSSSLTPTETNLEEALTTFQFANLSPDDSIYIRCQNKRYVSLKLHYYLTNTHMTPIETQITLPPDTAYQRLLFESIDPSPLYVNTDNDGNVIATYHLEPKEERHINVQAKALLTSEPNPNFVEKTILKSYINEQPQWPVHSPTVKKLTNALNTISHIYQYINNLTLLDPANNEKTHPNRSPDIAFGSNQTPVSGEGLIDIFVTLSRANNIMSRRLVGFSTTSNERLYPQSLLPQTLHVWADYYDDHQQQWVQVDPIWEKTSHMRYFPIPDLDHIVLAINGTTDTNPYPVGFYSVGASHDINITDIEPFDFPPAMISASLFLPFVNQIGLSPKTNLVVKNTSMQAIYNQPIQLLGDDHELQSVTIDRLLPQNQVIIPVTLAKRYGTYAISINQQTTNLKLLPATVITPIAVATALVCLAGFIAVFTRRLLVSRRK